MPHRDLAAEVHVREGLGHLERRLDRLARREVQQVDVDAVRLVGEVGRDADREALGVRRARGAVGAQPRELALLLHEPGVGGHDLGRLAVQAQADVVALVLELLHRALHAAHDELEVRDVVLLVLVDHQEFVLVARRAVQAVAAIEHVDLERRDAVLLDQHRDLVDVPAVHRREVVRVVDVEAPLRDLEHLGVEIGVGAALVQVVLARAEVVDARGDSALCSCTALGHRVFRERRIDASVHVRIDEAGERQQPLAVDDLARLLGRNFPRHPGELAVLDADVRFLHRSLVRADEADILDQQVVFLLYRHDGTPRTVNHRILHSAPARRSRRGWAGRSRPRSSECPRP